VHRPASLYPQIEDPLSFPGFRPALRRSSWILVGTGCCLHKWGVSLCINLDLEPIINQRHSAQGSFSLEGSYRFVGSDYRSRIGRYLDKGREGKVKLVRLKFLRFEDGKHAGHRYTNQPDAP